MVDSPIRPATGTHQATVAPASSTGWVVTRIGSTPSRAAAPMPSAATAIPPAVMVSEETPATARAEIRK